MCVTLEESQFFRLEKAVKNAQVGSGFPKPLPDSMA